MLRLLAASFQDGWAFVQRGRDLLVIRPPYHRTGSCLVSEATVEKAIHAYGFEARADRFPDWRSLLAFLREQLLLSHRSVVGMPSGPDAMSELLRRAPRETIDRYLDRIEQEFVPSREWDAALRLLTALIDLPVVKGNPGLCDRALRLLKRCFAARQALQAEREELAEDDLPHRFPAAVEQYGAAAISKRARAVSESGQLWAFAKSS
jgi:hypothetical protein